MKKSRINRAICKLEQDQPVFYTGGHTGAELTFEAGVEMADTWADYINIGFEHGFLDLPGLDQFMKGMASVAKPTPAVIVELPFEGRDPDFVRFNAWQVRQMLAIGVHGFLLCHAECPESVEALVEVTRYTFRGGTRGAGGQSTAATIWGTSQSEYLELADPWPLNPDGELLIGLKIENQRALSNAEATTQVPGVAFAEWGPADMSMSHGYRGKPEDLNRADIQAARSRVLKACLAAGVFFLDGATEDNLSQKFDEGVRIFPGSSELKDFALSRTSG